MPTAVPSEGSKGVAVVFPGPSGALGFATSFILEYQIMGWRFIMKQLFDKCFGIVSFEKSYKQ